MRVLVRSADGSILPADVSLSSLRFRDAEYLVVYINDVTERRRALAALRESEARLQGIAANVPGLVFRLERAPVTGQIDFAYISEGSSSDERSVGTEWVSTWRYWWWPCD